MKIKCACSLLMALLLFAWPLPSPAQADSAALEWTKIDKPGDNGNLVVTPCEVSEIAVASNDVVYAIDTPNSKFYRSLNGGITWVDMTDYLLDALDTDAELPVSKIAAAPDKPGIVAVVVNDNAGFATKVYLSTDGGEEWTDTDVPSLVVGTEQTTIQAIAISEEYTSGKKSYWEMAIGTAKWGDDKTSGQVWIYQFGNYGTTWQNQDLTIDPSHIGGEVSAFAYSPDHPNDKTLLVIASTSSSDVAAAYQNQTWLCLLKRDTGVWNGPAGYPVEIGTPTSPSAGDAPGVSYIHSSLALPSNYSNNSVSPIRVVFASYDREPDANDDVYRLIDTAVTRLDADGGSTLNISSLAYSGTTASGRLLVGDADPTGSLYNVQVRRTSNPFDSPPDWDTAEVPPTGPGNAKVAWSSDGKTAYCGTGQIPGVALDESAFSMSLDDGDKWRQMGLIDTVINISDVVPAPDGESLFVVTYNQYGPEGIWRSAGDPLGERWERLLTMDCSGDNSVILRLSLNYADDFTLYAAEADGSQLAVSHNRGNTWKWCRYPPGGCPGEPIIDLVVAAEDTVYAALPDGYVTKTTSGGYEWWTTVDTGLDEINMLSLFDEETLFVGGSNGDVAYSTDGGESYILIDEVIASGSGDVQVLADVNYPANSTIYAATNLPDEGIWRWVIGTSTEWEQIDESVAELGTGQQIGGLAMGPEGTLYALSMKSASVNISDTVDGTLEISYNNNTDNCDLDLSGSPVSSINGMPRNEALTIIAYNLACAQTVAIQPVTFTASTVGILTITAGAAGATFSYTPTTLPTDITCAAGSSPVTLAANASTTFDATSSNAGGTVTITVTAGSATFSVSGGAAKGISTYQYNAQGSLVVMGVDSGDTARIAVDEIIPCPACSTTNSAILVISGVLTISGYSSTNCVTGVWRTLTPLATDPDDIEFDLVNDNLPACSNFDPNSVYSHTLPYLKLWGNAEMNELWTIETTNRIIYRYQDTLCKVSPILTSPENGAVLPVDASGYISDLPICWEALEGAEEYEVTIYSDSETTKSMWSYSTASTLVQAAGTSEPARLLRDTEYYWRVRAIEPIRSLWSETRSLAASLSTALGSPLSDSASISPSCGAAGMSIKPAFCWQSVEGATGYEFILARDSEFTDMAIALTGADALPTNTWGCDVELAFSTTYFWKVRAISDVSYSEWGVSLFTTEAAPSAVLSPQITTSPTVISTSSIPSHLIVVLIGIGAALAISLIVLIVRTR